MGQEKVKWLLQRYCNSKTRQHNEISSFLVHSLHQGTYLCQPHRSSILKCLHSCPKLSSATYPCKLFHCLPRRPTTYACLLPITCLLVTVCIFFHLINQTFMKQECFRYFSNAYWGHNSFCLSLLESPFRIYTYPSIFKDKKQPSTFHNSLRWIYLRGLFKIDWKKTL